MPFAEEFIQGVLAGHNLKRSRDEQKRSDLRFKFEQEDREIEKQLLQHRMRELKIGERLQARAAASQNIDMLEGRPAEDIPFEMAEQTSPPENVMPGSVAPVPPFQMRPMQIPGVEELGVAGIKVRPQTMEQQLAAQHAANRAKALSEPYTLSASRGETTARMVGNQVIGALEGAGPETDYVKIRKRDKNGKLVEQLVPKGSPESLLPQELEPIPRANTTVNILSPTDRQANVDGIIAGNLPPVIPNTAEGLRIRAGLQQAGYNLSKAQGAWRAAQTRLQSLNTGDRANIRMAADSLESALGELAAANEGWERNFGPLNGVILSQARAGRLGAGQQAAAAEFDKALNAAKTQLAILRSGGVYPTKSGVDQAEATLTNSGSKASTKQTIDRLMLEAGYIINGIRTAEEAAVNVTQGGLNPAAQADFDWDPVTQSLVPRKK